MVYQAGIIAKVLYGLESAELKERIDRLAYDGPEDGASLFKTICYRDKGKRERPATSMDELQEAIEEAKISLGRWGEVPELGQQEDAELLR